MKPCWSSLGPVWSCCETVLASLRAVWSQGKPESILLWTSLLVSEPFQEPLGAWSFLEGYACAHCYHVWVQQSPGSLKRCAHENDDDVWLKYACRYNTSLELSWTYVRSIVSLTRPLSNCLKALSNTVNSLCQYCAQIL